MPPQIMQGRTFFSPAKINLFFRVLQRRPDHYHEIASLYQAISLGDQLTVVRASEDLLTSSDPALPVDRSNLIYKALDLFRQKTGETFPVRLHIEKKIPMQAGLGGGSSNAATTLWALNTLSAQPVSSETLALWGAELGSDVSFFFSQGTAYCTGRGEKLEPLQELPPVRLWLAKPAGGLSTVEVYRNCRIDELEPRDPKESLRKALQGEPSYFNDLEHSAFRLMPQLITVKRALEDLGFTQVVMTGSGSALFCLGEVARPTLPGIDFYPVEYIRRRDENWYF